MSGEDPLAVSRRDMFAGMLLHIINYSGQRNGRYDAPAELHGLNIGLRATSAKEARALVAGQSVSGVRRHGDDERVWFDLPPVGAFEAILVSG